MHTITVYPKSRPTLEEVQGFIRALPEGDWVSEAGTSRGVVEAEDGRIYLDYDERYRHYFDNYLSDQERADLSKRLGFSPTLALHVHISNAFRQSDQLARSVCQDLLRKWGGGYSD
jgi:hypothetical protein